ncbi:hypothetical protein K2173_027424 [Erythroxylum novogranatense]|uniref:FAF domain-containing protein n=1 Tax=Erythroxylum novogranatense TaxID=1862640 RepID=A0AAV8TZ75_9ROSI|nr:hypothetical protein K2173_027424 [Erythroxylum novogranatense]
MIKQIDSPDHQNKSLDKVRSLNIMGSGILASSRMSSSPPSSSLTGDYIGVESCLDLKASNEEVFTQENSSYRSCVQRSSKRIQRSSSRNRGEFPPPIPLLARTENLPCRMPWVLRRYYTSDGRLILREEKVRHHEYFRAHRSNGRLTLHLVPLDNVHVFNHVSNGRKEAESYEQISHVEENEVGLEKVDREDVVVTDQNCLDVDSDHLTATDKTSGDDDKVQSVDVTVTDEHEVVHEDQKIYPLDVENGGIGGNGSFGAASGKCLNFVDSVMTSPTCIFGVPVAALRPVHS